MYSNEEGEISYKDKIISLFYFRAGYTPSDYKDEESWKGREIIELSIAIKEPNININQGEKKYRKKSREQINKFKLSIDKHLKIKKERIFQQKKKH